MLAILVIKLWSVLASTPCELAGDALTGLANAPGTVSGSFLLGLACGWMRDRAARGDPPRHMTVLQIALVIPTALLAVAAGRCRRC